MRSAVEYVGYVNLVLYTVVAVVAVRQWLQHREAAALWAALTFVTLAAVVDTSELLPEDPNEWITRGVIAVLVLFPYLLYRFAVAFRPPSRRLSLVVGGLTVVLLGWTWLIPDIPEEGEAYSTGYTAYVVAFVLHWTLLTVIVTMRLWAAGRGEASVARRRMRLLAMASAAITLALIVAASNPEEGSAAALATALLTTAAALAFLVGFSPPPLLRAIWRRPEQARLQNAIAGIMGATTVDQVVERVLPPMAEIVGARGVEIRDPAGVVLGRHGETDGSARRTVVPGADDGEVVVWTSPYAPFFGGEELRLLGSLAGLTALALDRARLFAREREARMALERAAEIKTNFVALAAHELRTPAATIHGLVETIHVRRDELDTSRIRELEDALRDQAHRMRNLVDQLLDMSRLDAEAVRIEPERLRVRSRVEDLIAATAAARAGDIEVAVSPELEANVDPDAFDRIVSNLIVNALRYGGAPVRVSAEQNDRHFRLTVEDRGPGVAPEFVPSLFDRFTRSHESARAVGGTGLGLAIARSYARAHRGDLFYEAAEPRGARFRLVLPTQSAP